MTYIKAFFETKTWVWIRRIYIGYSVIADVVVILGIIGIAGGFISIGF